MRVLGLSSGTSHDGIDVALVAFAPAGEVLDARLEHHGTVPFEPGLREAIRAALPPARIGLDEVLRLDVRLGEAFAEAAAAASVAGAELVCSHGQTVFHAATDGTLQIGQPAVIAERTGLPVVADVRVRDVAAGGQGAPLVAVLDLMLLRDRPDRAGALNIGGIANLTVAVPGAETAYDIGPGNALLDAAALALTGADRDHDGALAARGTVLPDLLDRLLAEPYYARPAPKSTGKELFHAGYLDGLLRRSGPGRRAGHADRADGGDDSDRRRPAPARNGRRVGRRSAQPDADAPHLHPRARHRVPALRRARPARRRQGGGGVRADRLADLARPAGERSRRRPAPGEPGSSARSRRGRTG